MVFELVWSKNARKDISKLETQLSKRIKNKIKKLSLDDPPELEKVKGQDFYKYRIGHYRVFFDAYPFSKKLVVLQIKHRKNAYKKL